MFDEVMSQKEQDRASSEVRRAVIPAAGLGTRLRPLTRFMPKEMLPVQLRPMIEYAVAEAARSGATEICIVVAPQKHELLRAYFADAPLREATIQFVVQPEPLGLMDAVRRAADFVGRDPFALLLPDNIIVGSPATAQLIEAWAKYGTHVVGLIKPSPDERSALGARAPLTLASIGGERDYRIRAVGLEKRSLDTWAGERSITNIGRYIFGVDVLTAIETVAGRSGSGELDDVAVMGELAERGRLMGRVIDGEYYDVGNPVGYWRANCRFAPIDDLAGRLALPADGG